MSTNVAPVNTTSNNTVVGYPDSPTFRLALWAISIKEALAEFAGPAWDHSVRELWPKVVFAQIALWGRWDFAPEELSGHTEFLHLNRRRDFEVPLVNLVPRLAAEAEFGDFHGFTPVINCQVILKNGVHLDMEVSGKCRVGWNPYL